MMDDSSQLALTLSRIFFDDEEDSEDDGFVIITPGRRKLYEMRPIHALYQNRISANTSFLAILPRDVTEMIIDYLNLDPERSNIARRDAINYIIHVQVCRTADAGKY
jgi:hypothetical protein